MEYVLRSFVKDKSLGPDGWTMELFLYFFDLMGEDLVNMVECRVQQRISRSLNSTFIALIPKYLKFVTFQDYCSKDQR